MSIKYKIPLVMFIAFLLNILILGLCYQFILSGRVDSYQRNMYQTVKQATDDIETAISGKTYTEALACLNAYNNPRSFEFSIQGLSDQSDIGDNTDYDYIGFSVSNTINLKEGMYLLTVKKSIDLSNLRSHNIFLELLFFEIIILFIMFGLVAIYIYRRYASDLIKLRKKMNDYRNGENIEIINPRKDEIGQLESDFAILSQSLREEKQRQNRIIASISHDIKTPLTSVLGYSERISKKELSRDKQKKYIETIYKQARDIESIVDEFDDYLLAFSLEKKQYQKIEVDYICKMLDDEYTALLSEQNVSFSVVNNCGSMAAVTVDLLKLRRVFANVIANSIKHSGIHSLIVRIIVSQNDDGIMFEISDNGCGMSETDLQYAFEPFYTSDKSRRVSGLGLSICKQIVEGHRGTIHAFNGEKDSGFTVVLKLPLC